MSDEVHDQRRILVIFGTRPEAIKLAPVIRTLAAHPGRFTVRTCVTAQHREMLDQVLNLFGITPDIDLDLMETNQSLSGLSARILNKLDPVIVSEKPNWILVQGDTTTVMMSALAAQHRCVKVGHVEAGLRTGDRQNPFPEEMNRVVTDHISDLCFAPTEAARQHLLGEGISENNIIVTGNTVIDALHYIADQPWQPPENSILAQMSAERDWILVTAHRRENFGLPLENICLALQEISRRLYGRVQIVYPVHRNPMVWQTVHRLLKDVPGIVLLPPVDYREIIYLMKKSKLILTDSGGIQEEAPTFNKPVLVLRKSTERQEAVEIGASKVIGTDKTAIVTETIKLLSNPDEFRLMSQSPNPYGDGLASERIAHAIIMHK
ncbi:MAG: UDP-N-acetylglucosamine 2-epimerase (non-hydrolyzing) [Caldilineales bacterium]|nr:UDP-N-acetylglucosamine 2-epimerase (non-hydrolyzing) [Caldilineales bacterium]